MATPLEIDCTTVKRNLDSGRSFLFLDVREPDEYETARINGTTLIPMSQIATRVAELDPFREQEIVVHCHHGGRSMRVVNWLRQQGFSHAINMAGGIDEWSEKIDSTIPRY